MEEDFGMSDAVRLRSSNGDEDQIMSVWREASRAGHPFLSEEDLDAQERLARREHLPRADIVVAERDGQIVGFIATLGEEVGGLFVSPAVQRQGIGRRLIEDAQARSTSLSLGVYEANAQARAFYEQVGFSQVGKNDHDDEGRPLPLIRLAWKRS